MFPRARFGLEGRQEPAAKTDLAPPAPVKPPSGGQRALPGFLRTVKTNPKQQLPTSDRALANTDITSFRGGTTTRQVMLDMARASPDMSAAVAAYVRMGITDNFSAIAYNLDGTVNADATGLLAQIVTRMNVLQDYSLGYDDSPSLRSLSETWARELMLYGAMAGELVLNKARQPDKIHPINVPQIRFYPTPDGKRVVPKQTLSGAEIDLNYATFFMTSLDQDTTSAYPESCMEPAIQAAIASADFMNDLRRIIKRSIHPRTHLSIDYEQFRKSVPQDIALDPDAMNTYMQSVVESLSSKIDGLQPEDSLVTFDTVDYKVVDHGNTNLDKEWEQYESMVRARMATGAKVLPTILGHSDGTSNTASAEVMMFVKAVEGTVWGKLNEMFSKMFTLAVRLFGLDVYVEFKFEPVNLRPKDELESFFSMRQSRILDQLSLGLITDEVASILLTGRLPPAGYKRLSGTGFRATAKTEPAGQGYNGASNSGSTLNQNLNSTAPAQTKGSPKGGQNSSAEVVHFPWAQQQ